MATPEKLNMELDRKKGPKANIQMMQWTRELSPLQQNVGLRNTETPKRKKARLLHNTILQIREFQRKDLDS